MSDNTIFNELFGSRFDLPGYRIVADTSKGKTSVLYRELEVVKNIQPVRESLSEADKADSIAVSSVLLELLCRLFSVKEIGPLFRSLTPFFKGVACHYYTLSDTHATGAAQVTFFCANDVSFTIPILELYFWIIGINQDTNDPSQLTMVAPIKNMGLFLTTLSPVLLRAVKSETPTWYSLTFSGAEDGSVTLQFSSTDEQYTGSITEEKGFQSNLGPVYSFLSGLILESIGDSLRLFSTMPLVINPERVRKNPITLFVLLGNDRLIAVSKYLPAT